MKKDILSFIAKADEETVLKIDNIFFLTEKIQESCAELYDKNLIYEILEFASFPQSYSARAEVMFTAAETGNLEVIKFLVESGGDVDKFYDLSLYLAKLRGQAEIKEYMISEISKKRASENEYPALPSGNLFRIITNDGKQDLMLMASEFLRQRAARQENV